MKDKKKLSIILGVVGIALIIFGIILSFISNVKKDQKEMNSRMNTIVTEYSKFEKNIEEFNKTRKSLHEEFLDKVKEIFPATIAARDGKNVTLKFEDA